MIGKLCLHCNNPTKSNEDFCSPECYDHWHRRNRLQWLKNRILEERGLKCIKCDFEVKYEKGFYIVVNDPLGLAFVDRNKIGTVYAKIPLAVVHIKPIALAPELEYAESNLQILCKWCKRTKTKNEKKIIETIYGEKTHGNIKSN